MVVNTLPISRSRYSGGTSNTPTSDDFIVLGLLLSWMIWRSVIIRVLNLENGWLYTSSTPLCGERWTGILGECGGVCVCACYDGFHLKWCLLSSMSINDWGSWFHSVAVRGRKAYLLMSDDVLMVIMVMNDLVWEWRVGRFTGCSRVLTGIVKTFIPLLFYSIVQCQLSFRYWCWYNVFLTCKTH